MQTLSSIIIFLLMLGNLSAQSKFGIATYTPPLGWKVNSEMDKITIEKTQTKGNVCRITIFKTEDIAVNSFASFVNSISNKELNDVQYIKSKTSVKSSEVGGHISFGTTGTPGGLGKKAGSSKAYIYSFSNNSQTFFVQCISSDAICIDELKQFLASLLIDVPEKEPSGSGMQVRKKKAAAAAPAAPAPIM